MDSFIFYVFLFIHLVSLIVGFGAVIVIDSFGFLWLTGLKKLTIPFLNKVADTTQQLIWLGWGGLVFSGIFLITIKGYVDNLTKIKLFFVLMLGINGIFLHFIKKSMEKLGEHQQMPAVLKFRIGLASAISQLGWWGALSIGFVHRHWRHNIAWPKDYIFIIVTIIVIILTIAVIGESIFKKRKS